MKTRTPNPISNEPSATWSKLFDATLSTFGEDSRVWKGDWKSQCDPLREKLKEALIVEALRAERWLGAKIQNRLVISSCSLEHVPFCAWGFLTPHAEWFQREGEPQHEPPVEGPFYIKAELQAAMLADTQGYFLRPHVTLELSVSYEMCAPFRWLLHEWRRPLAHMLVWCKEAPRLNDAFRPKLEGFRGNDVLKKISLYLEDPGDDPAFDFIFTFSNTNTPDEITRSLAVFLAIWDSLYSLTIPRCDPDRLHKHYLTLRGYLPNMPFRESFYDPGIELPAFPPPKV